MGEKRCFVMTTKFKFAFHETVVLFLSHTIVMSKDTLLKYLDLSLI